MLTLRWLERKVSQSVRYFHAMFAVKAQCSLADAKNYFEEHLCVGDYYREGQRISGQWFGKGAEDLGLAGVTQAQDFWRLCDNLHPKTGERLTQRLKTTRREAGDDGQPREVANRRVFYDFTLSPPKSVSIVALAGNESRIVAAHDAAVMAALKQVEMFAASRVRKKGQSSYRTTGNLVGAVFQHDTSRALDPHLHSHCILFNATRDPVENCWKALEPYEMLVAKKFVENVYYHELVKALHQFGYQVRNKSRGDFEIEGVSQELIERFSKRHQEIDQKTRELLEREPDKANQNIHEIRDRIAHKERARKIKDVGLDRLQEIWDVQMTPGERVSLQNARTEKAITESRGLESAEAVVTWAEEHLFERHSVVREHEIWRHTLEHARGQNITLGEIQAVTKQRDYVRDVERPGHVATRVGLEREWAMVKIARDGCCEFHLTDASRSPMDAPYRSITAGLPMAMPLHPTASRAKPWTTSFSLTRLLVQQPARSNGM